MHAPEAVANDFLKKAWSNSLELTPIQVLKLTYIAHGWTLGCTEEPLVSESIEAWRYGPVIPSLYQQFKHFGNQAIDSLAQNPGSPPHTSNYSSDQSTILEAVWDNYGKMDGMRLSTLTHQEGTPWHEVWVIEGGSEMANNIIEDEKIKKHYKDLISSREPVHG